MIDNLGKGLNKNNNVHVFKWVRATGELSLAGLGYFSLKWELWKTLNSSQILSAGAEFRV